MVNDRTEKLSLANADLQNEISARSRLDGLLQENLASLKRLHAIIVQNIALDEKIFQLLSLGREMLDLPMGPRRNPPGQPDCAETPFYARSTSNPA